MAQHVNDTASGAEALWRTIGQLRGQLRPMVAVFSLLACVAIAVALLLPRSFTAETVMLVDARRNPIFESSSPVIPLQADTNAINSEVSLVQVADTLARVVDRLALLEDPRYSKSESRQSNWPKAPEIFAGLTSYWPVGNNPALPISPDRLKQAEAIKRLQSGLRVINDPRTYTLRVRYSSSDPYHAAAVSNAVAETYVDAQRDARVQGLRARIVSKALVPVEPSTPRRTTIVGLGLLAASGAALTFGAVRAKMRRTFRSATEIEAQLGLPVAASIPKVARKHATAASILGSKTPALNKAGQSFASFVLTSKAAPKVVLVSSASAGEGKSVAALVLATSLAKAGHSCLLIEASPSNFTYPVGGSPSNAVGSPPALSAAESGVEGLCVMSWADSAASDERGAHQLDSILLAARERYSILVIDGPPIAAAHALARAADEIVLAIKWDWSSPATVARAAELCTRMGKPPTLVLTQVDRRQMSRHERGYIEAFS